MSSRVPQNEEWACETFAEDAARGWRGFFNHGFHGWHGWKKMSFITRWFHPCHPRHPWSQQPRHPCLFGEVSDGRTFGTHAQKLCKKWASETEKEPRLPACAVGLGRRTSFSAGRLEVCQPSPAAQAGSAGFLCRARPFAPPAQRRWKKSVVQRGWRKGPRKTRRDTEPEALLPCPFVPSVDPFLTFYTAS